LNACVRVGIPKSHLFDVFDLHAKKNMPQVLCNLEVVSKMKIYNTESGTLSSGPSLPPRSFSLSLSLSLSLLPKLTHSPTHSFIKELYSMFYM
jgi:hypothetical protein